MAQRKWQRKLVCKICGDPIDINEGKVCVNCSDETEDIASIFSNTALAINRKLAVGFSTLFASEDDNLDY